MSEFQRSTVLAVCRFHRRNRPVAHASQRGKCTFPIASYADDYTFRCRRGSVFIGRIGTLQGNFSPTIPSTGRENGCKEGKEGRQAGRREEGREEGPRSEEGW